MTDVMLVESRSGAGDEACDALRAAGCTIHRCDAPDEAGTALPCRAIDEPGACPLAIGVDVALVVRDQIDEGTAGLEPGLTCALRAGVPVVVEGSTRFDPYEHRVTACSGDVVDTCRRAVEASRRPWQERLARVTEPIVGDDVEVVWSIDTTPDRTHLIGHGPPIDARLRDRIAVRAIGAVRGSPLARPRIDVSYRSNS
jgi:hypothetical protein